VERFEVLGACIGGTLHGLTAENGTAIEIGVTTSYFKIGYPRAQLGI
jgi:hypothetical protein